MMGLRQPVRRTVLVGALVAALCAAAGCGDGAASDGVETTAGALDWTLAWDTTGVAYTDAGWSTETALGYTVEVTDGWLVTREVQLVPCPDEDTAARRILRALAPVQTAWAGHPDDDRDPSAVYGLAESLADPSDTRLPAASTAGGPYCRAHYLAARADSDIEDLPTDVDLDRVTLTLAGTWTHPDGSSGSFDVSTSLNTGTFIELDAEIAAGDGVSVEVVRPLAALVDTIDFATADDDAISSAVLTALVDTVGLRVR